MIAGKDLAGKQLAGKAIAGKAGRGPSAYNKFMSAELKKAGVKGKGKEAVRKAFKEAVAEWKKHKASR